MKFRELLPPEIAVRESTTEVVDFSLWPVESRAITRATEARRSEFTTGRTLARSALAEVGAVTGPIPVGTGREPLWPSGFIGSISHCVGYRAAAAARITDAAWLGIDVEVAATLDAATEQIVVNHKEDVLPSNVAEIGPAICFSVKESAYKAVFPATRVGMNLQEIHVHISRAGRFVAHVNIPGVPRTLQRITGKWSVDRGLIFTAAFPEVDSRSCIPEIK